jgi:mono/diheme cytochrome c family protein
VVAAERRLKIPVWVLPVVALLPLWAFLYAESLREPEVVLTGPVAEGEGIYARACSGCHGAGGGGGAGRPLNGGNVVLTFPGEAGLEEQIKFVTNGSRIGVPYGDPARPGGQHVGGSYNGAAMPPQGLDAEGATKGSLTHEEVLAVACYERVVIGGEDPAPAACEGGEGGASASGH